MADDLQDNIRESAAGPKRASADGVDVEQHPLADQIAADRYLASKGATRKQGLGITLKKLVPPAAD